MLHLNKLKNSLLKKQKRSKAMEQYNIQITVGDEGVFIDFDSNMPCILADKIKEVVKDFYKE